MPDYDQLAQKFGAVAPDAAGDKYDQLAQKFTGQAAKPSKPFGQQLNEAIADVPRQLGLTARMGLEGAGDMANFVSAPIRGALNLVLPKDRGGLAGQITGAAPRDAIQPMNLGGIADAIGLPKPRDATERIVGDAGRMVVGGLLPIGAGAALAKNGSGMAQAVGRVLASNPGQQLASAGAAGAAGGYTRETGGDNTSQLLASLAAGVATPFALQAAQRGGAALASAGRRIGSQPAPPQVQVDVTINNALHESGLDLGQLPREVAAGIRADVAKAMQIGGNLSPDAVRRLADYRMTGLTPTAAGLSLDPATVTRQRNLAKLGINSRDPAAQQLGMTQNANNQALTGGLNELGAATADDALAGAGKVVGALERRNARAQGLINDHYAAARGADGRSAALDPDAFTGRTKELLDDALLGWKVPGDVRKRLEAVAAGDMPLTVDVAEQFKTRLADLGRISTNGGEIKALSLIRKALDETPLLPGQDIGQTALDAFGKARNLNRTWMSVVERTPALQAVRNGIEPDKFVQQFIVGAGPKADVMDVAMLKSSIKTSPEAMGAVRDQITSYLKQKALNGAADEVGNFSQSAYNKALSAIGDRKLRLFFEPADISQMKALGRVASYEQFQPAGSAVNNSNTASAGLGALLDRIGSSPLLSKIPLGRQVLADPLQNIALSMQAKQALNVPRALTDGVRQGGPARPWEMTVSPAAFMLPDEERVKQQRGLLFP